MTRVPRRVTVGEQLQSRTFGPLTQTDVVRFAGAGGDFNPLHHDPAAAASAGFDAPIAMGQLTAGLLAAWVTDLFGVEHLRALDVRFTAPFRLGETAVLGGEVTSVEAEVATMALSATTAAATILSGSARVVVSA